VLEDDVVVMPTHGFGSFCSSEAVDAGDASTIGDERKQNLALTLTDEDEFVQRLLGGLDAYPRYYAHMAPRNRQGPEPIDLSPPAPADATEIRARIHSGEWVVDLRNRTVFADDFLQGTVNIELEDSFSTYLGWLIPWNMPVTLVGDTADEIAEAQRQLVRIGIERPAAAADGGVDAFAGDGQRRSYRIVDFGDVADMGDGDRPAILDVRRDDEWSESRVPGATHVPLHELDRRITEVPHGEVWVHCRSGYRASIAASLLARAGRDPVLIDDDYERAAELGLTRTP
jgi:hydroxyacylglutathione hydrolase